MSIVHRFHKGDVTSVVTDVAEFMKTLLNDCSGEILDDDYDFPADPKETSSLSFLVLRVLSRIHSRISVTVVVSGFCDGTRVQCLK